MLDREYIARNQIDCSKRKNRKILHNIPTKNVLAKAWWQFAIQCVIKENRQKTKGNWNEFTVPSLTKEHHYSALELILNAMLD